MAGTRFIQGTLASEVEANYNRLIEGAKEKLATALATSHDEEHETWRRTAEVKVHQLHERVVEGLATDSELSHFSISSPPYPHEERYAIRDAENEIERLTKARDKALAYIRSLAPADLTPPNGSGIQSNIVEVSAVDLKRIGYGV